MSGSSSPEEIQRQIDTRDLLNLAIWQRVYELISQSLAKKMTAPDAPESATVIAQSTKQEETMKLPWLYAEADPPLSERTLTNIGKVSAEGDDRYEYLVMSVSIGRAILRNNIRAGAYDTYNLFETGKLAKQVFVGFPEDEMPLKLGETEDIGLIDRQRLLTELQDIESIV
ncbi:MAG TPA: hypothetical protein VLE69_00280 [Candidatus Saccharimonadales bacterium]|nr:hypothetical protein [Candidatus Saccharimonadales bacterium]